MQIEASNFMKIPTYFPNPRSLNEIMNLLVELQRFYPMFPFFFFQTVRRFIILFQIACDQPDKERIADAQMMNLAPMIRQFFGAKNLREQLERFVFLETIRNVYLFSLLLRNIVENLESGNNVISKNLFITDKNIYYYLLPCFAWLSASCNLFHERL